MFVISLSILCLFRPYSHSLARAGVLFRSLRYYLSRAYIHSLARAGVFIISLRYYLFIDTISALSSKGRSVIQIFVILFDSFEHIYTLYQGYECLFI